LAFISDRLCVSLPSLCAGRFWITALQRVFVQPLPPTNMPSWFADHEDAFIDLTFALDSIEGMTANDVKRYIRFIADRRLTQLGL
jgi:hypothetical protein